MKSSACRYATAGSVREACQLLEEGAGSSCPIAGGTDLVMALKNRQKAPKLLVDLGALPLHQITYSTTEGLRIGALVSLRHLADHPVVRKKYSILAQAALSVGSVQLRAMGTVGGNLCQDARCMFFNRPATERRSLEPCHKLGGEVCHVACGSDQCWASYAGDLAPALLVLRAKLRINDADGEKVISLRELFSGDGKCPHTLRPGQLVSEIHIPSPSPHSGGAYLKLRQRETLDYPLVGVAAYVAVEAGGAVCKDAAVALTGVAQAPVEVEAAGRLHGRRITGEAIQELAEAASKKAHPVKNVCGLEVRYRLKLVHVYAESALRQALQAAAM